jgi:ABC-type uncharacterized transport system permease subunit
MIDPVLMSLGFAVGALVGLTDIGVEAQGG